MSTPDTNSNSSQDTSAIDSSREKLDGYASRIISSKQPSYGALQDLMNEPRVAANTPNGSVQHNIPQNRPNIQSSATKITAYIVGSGVSGSNRKELTANELAKELSTHESSRASTLLVVENVDRTTVEILGAYFDIEPQFFADHFNDQPWYRITSVPPRLPQLPSSQKIQNFLQIRYVQPRTIVENPAAASSNSKATSLNGCDPVSDTESVLYPDKESTRIPRKAGKWRRIKRPQKNTSSVLSFKLLILTRQVVTAWFKNRSSGGWIGVLLVDPPFKLPSQKYILESPEHHKFIDDQPSHQFGTSSSDNPSIGDTLVSYLDSRQASDGAFFNSLKSDCFLALGDLYGSAASNWVITNEDWAEDFGWLEDKTKETRDRIEKNINLISALVAIGEGEQSLQENHGLARLTLLAAVFLPFSTLAAVAAIPGSYKPVSLRIKLFWIMAPLLMAGILIVFAFSQYSGKTRRGTRK
ncbi:hypothetical protein B0O99DRAFT_687521 [Bisporella sp. PMI_857]|nr:hypothetical protein B0O99DRAFT_687521 [Bisporella sp. PMI_857]